MAHLAEKLKEEGNALFKTGDYVAATSKYSAAIQKDPTNPFLFTNRAYARIKLEEWSPVIDDCLKSLELNPNNNIKAYYYLAQAQMGLKHPNEALTSALTAYNVALFTRSTSTNSAAELVTSCKKAKFEARERDRLRTRGALRVLLEDKLQQDLDEELESINEKLKSGDMRGHDADQERRWAREAWKKNVDELRSTFAVADPQNQPHREVPDYFLDGITFEVMNDPVVTKNGQSYDRTTIIEHLKRSPYDPLTREPLTINDLRPNLALRSAIEEFWKNNAGWVVDW
ncbi:U-box-domain-containing protein [Viridothelium virens]|uniref:U-box-domain-containing protein n=1 Tax=Viridothelium virens TaxID=1048519 RepID=A0A6A6HG91_VIRVR|nr:U-box-domain-containing protein [Viridothelium virens]